MAESKVYMTDFRTRLDVSLLKKFEKLLKSAGIEKIDFKNKFVAIKVHFGEKGNLAVVRPQYVRVLVDLIRDCGGRPFLTDCNTLYVGSRKHALEHIETAYLNGFNPYVVGCHVIIADGLKGNDDLPIPVVGGQFVKEAKIGRAIADADIIISLNHFKMHECAGIGGAIKNLGMGCGSRAGKMEMHSAGKPQVNASLCINCGACRRGCAHRAIGEVKKKALIDPERCVGCGRCIGRCPVDAIEPQYDVAFDVLNKKVVEYACAVVKDKESFHISFANDISPFCDCHTENDLPVVPDIGILASFDPVAIDLACTDLVNAQPVTPGSLLDKTPRNGDHFHTIHPTTDWHVAIEYGVQMGLGQKQYRLVKV
ncbi:MAG: DUF362 domain-containing protein [Planctomycetia bacterium]|nr:DUF362 domain-containing protein [Planctomycetia bacterium]